MCLSDKDILDYIHTQSSLIGKSGVIPGRLRDSTGRLTPFLSDERLVYVNGNFTQSIHNITTTNNYKCHVWHKTLKKTLVAGVEKWITPQHKQKNVKLE